MAGDDLITAYVGDLTQRLGGRSGPFADEVRDHLIESADDRVARGAGREDAVREAIASFGTATEVAGRYAASGVGMAGAFTRAAGVASIGAAVLVAAAIGAFVAADLVELQQPWEALPRTLGSIATLAVVAGLVLGCVGAVGLLRRQGRVSGRAVAAVAFLGVAATSALAAWFVWVWLTALALGAGILCARLRRADLAPRRAALLMGIGAVAAAAIPWFDAAARWTGYAAVPEEVVSVVASVAILVWTSGVGSLGVWLVRDGSRAAPA